MARKNRFAHLNEKVIDWRLPAREERIREVVARRQAGLIVVLECVHDPHNAAAIFRSCEAFGVQEVYLVFEPGKAYNPRRIGGKSSSTANKWLDFVIHEDTASALQSLKDENYQLIATTLGENSVSLFNKDFTPLPKIALLVGNEHRGLSQEAIKAADHEIIIPMAGMVQSLNVSVAAALVVFEIMRQRTASGRDWTLSEDEQDALVRRLLKR